MIRRLFRLAAVATVMVPSAARAQVRLEDDAEHDRFVISIGPVDLPAMAEHHGAHGAVYPPVEEVKFPFDAYLYGFGYEVVDADGGTVSNQVVHHINFIDPMHRELFLPISMRLMAAGGETGDQKLPWLLFGLPVEAGQPLVVSVMLHNPTGAEVHGATVRFWMSYVKAGRPWPFFAVRPFQLDAAFPYGDKSWDLPVGSSSRSWDSKPAIPGRILAMGGHLHEYATRLAFEDVTASKTLWEGRPYTDDQGNVNRLAFSLFYRKLGLTLDTAHVYRVTVDYLNPTAEMIPRGAMGVVAGVFLPAGDAAWPATDTADVDYLMDRQHYLRQLQGTRDEMLAQLERAGNTGAVPAGEPMYHQH